jgi:ribosomal protein L31
MANDRYTQPKKALSGGFEYSAALGTGATTLTAVTAKITTPSDAPMKHKIHVQRLVVIVTTGSAKTWTFRSATTHTAIAVLDMTTTGTKYDIDFGPQGIAVDINENLEILISAAGAAATVLIEGFQERTATEIPTITGVVPQTGNAGTRAEVYGYNMKPGVGITFGGVSATDVIVYEGGRHASCIVPAHANGAVSVVFLNTDTTTATKTTAFTYA